MNAMELSRRYFFDIAAPRLRNDFPDNFKRMAAGLVGNGSECFGYDDEISRDHDWGTDFFIWIPECDRTDTAALQRWKTSLFEEVPPDYARTPSEYGARIGVMTVGDFYASLIGFPEGPSSVMDWFRIPEENLAMAVNGEVFIDNDGQFTATRQKLLCHYPEDLCRKKLAAKCMAIAQTGQYNLSRCYQRQDWVTYKTTLARFNDSVIAAVFLLNRTFRPYYKWAFRRMKELPILGKEVGRILESIAVTGGTDLDAFQKNQHHISDICALLVSQLRQQKLACSQDWFMTTQGEEIQRSIQDRFLRSLPAQYE